MTDWATSGRVKIERAEEHIRLLDAEVRAFRLSNPYEVFTDDDHETGDHVLRVHVHASPRTLLWFGAIAADAIHNLRASLDHMAWQLVVANGGTPTKNTNFPIGDRAEDFESLLRSKVKGASEEAMNRIRAIHPYKEGNLQLWTLHQLDIIEKHHNLVPVGAAIGTLLIEDIVAPHVRALYPFLPRVGSALPPMNPRYPLEEGTEIYRVLAAHRTPMQVDPQFIFEVAFGEGEIVKGEYLVPLLDKFLEQVGVITSRFTDLLA
jgi:hypothetical protein